MSQYSYIGKGKVYIEKLGEAGPRRFLGNCSAVNLNAAESPIELRDFTQAGGAMDDVVRQVTGVKIQIDMRNLSPENFALGVMGTAAAVTAGVVSAEEHLLYPGGLVRLNNIPDPNEALTLTGLTEGTHFERTKAGVFILEDQPTGGVEAGDTGTFGYTKLAGSLIQALVQTGDEYALTFEGLNEAKPDGQRGRPVIVDVYRVKFGPAGSIALIGNDFATLQVTGDCLADDSITDETLSQYFKVEMATAA